MTTATHKRAKKIASAALKAIFTIRKMQDEAATEDARRSGQFTCPRCHTHVLNWSATARGGFSACCTGPRCLSFIGH